MRILILISVLFVNTATYAEYIGLSAHEVQTKLNYLSAEIIDKISIDEGLGIQGRISHFTATRFMVDGGYGFHSGDREHRAFLGGAYEIIPDHNLQPRISLKAHIELVGEFSDFDFLAGFTPIASKGISLDDQVLYPYIGLPIKKVFRKNSKTRIAIAIGSTWQIQKNLLLSFETNINLKNTPGSFLIGISTNL